MSLEELTDQDVLYVKDSPMRTLILKKLSEQTQDYVRVRELAGSIKKNAGTVNFHCKGLERRSLVQTETVVGKTLVKITEKGTMVINKITKKQGAKKT